MKKVVVISGVSFGLGKKIAEDLLTAGYFVIGISRTTTNLNISDQLKANFYHYVYDLSDTTNIPKLTSEILKLSPSIYGLINNAAIGRDGVLPTLHNTHIQETINLNLLSPILLTKYISRSMLENSKGRIINITSIVANAGYKGLSVYAATKAGLEGFSRSLAREIGSRNVTVNCVAPGFLNTNMTADLAHTKKEKIVARSALARLATLEEVSATVQFLLSDDAGGITGTTLVVDAGNTV